VHCFHRERKVRGVGADGHEEVQVFFLADDGLVWSLRHTKVVEVSLYRFRYRLTVCLGDHYRCGGNDLTFTYGKTASFNLKRSLHDGATVINVGENLTNRLNLLFPLARVPQVVATERTALAVGDVLGPPRQVSTL